jgi:tetraprenyl-beta-curcumene synthase
LNAARRYWLGVFPRVRHESRYWRKYAEAIPDPLLRALALEAQRVKRSNVEGSAAFAVFAPSTHRTETIRAQVAFQSIYDYVDTLAEQPNENPVTNARLLHEALLVAFSDRSGHPDYYACCRHREDGGYLERLVDACRDALSTLPSATAIIGPARQLTTLIVAYQSLNLTDRQGGHRLLEAWARSHTPHASDLKWWETAAAAGSSLGVFALITAAARPALSPAEATDIETAYWPWVGALHSLLDSLVDEQEDTAQGQRSLLAYYDTPQEVAARLEALARGALAALDALPNAQEHALLLAAMASSYLTVPVAPSEAAILVSHRLAETFGPIIRPSIALLTARRDAGRILRSCRSAAAGREPSNRAAGSPTDPSASSAPGHGHIEPGRPHPICLREATRTPAVAPMSSDVRKLRDRDVLEEVSVSAAPTRVVPITMRRAPEASRKESR